MFGTEAWLSLADMTQPRSSKAQMQLHPGGPTTTRTRMRLPSVTTMACTSCCGQL